jgi:LysR family transcriptional regulator, transcriptional activator of nhaA
MLNFNHLFYFHVAALEGSVGAAAAKLGVTQPTVSEQLRALERSLDTTLFLRSPTGLKLSDAGRTAFERTSIMFREADRLIHDLQKHPTTQPRQLRIGVSGFVARSTSGRYLLPLLRLDATPTIKLVEGIDHIKSLKAGTLDVVICEQVPPDYDLKDIEVTLLEREKLVVIAHPRTNLVGDWSDLKLIHYPSGSRYRWDVDAFLERHKLKPRIAAEAEDALFLLEAAASGDFIAIVPRQIADEPLAAARIKIIETIDTELTDIYALRRTTATSELAKLAVAALAR